MVLALLGMHGFMQPLRTQGKAGCGAEYLWGRSSVPDPISLRQFLPVSCNGSKPMHSVSHSSPQLPKNCFWLQHSFPS